MWIKYKSKSIDWSLLFWGLVDLAWFGWIAYNVITRGI